MTEKRFTKYVPDSYNYTSVITIVDHETGKRSGSIDDFVDMLNALHEERNYFERKKCEYWNKFNLVHLDNINLQKENEQLKSRVEYLERKIDRERTSYQKQHEKWEEEIQKENEQLKSDLQYWRTLAQSLAKKNDVGGFK